MKNMFFLCLLLYTAAVSAQVKKVSIQAGGLTCSMCDKAIYKALSSLNFVENVDVNMKSSTFEITFKPGADVDFDKLKGQVEDAGFFVEGFWATVHFDNLKIKNDAAIQTIGKNLMFLHVTEQELQGDKTLRFLDKGYVPAKEYRKNHAFTNEPSYKTGTAEAPDAKNGIPKGARIYHVTI